MTFPLWDTIEGVAIDLDGTLIDSAPDLAQAANRLLVSAGRAPLAHARIVSMIGHGIDTLFERVIDAGFAVAPETGELDVLRKTFIDLYRERIFDRGTVYPGVVEGLEYLRDNGKRIACVTNKRADLSVPLLRASGLETFLSPVLCAHSREDRKPSPAMLLRLAAHWQTEPGSVLMVGDSRLDIESARAAGCPVAAVSYGYESVETLTHARPDRLLGGFAGIRHLFPSADAARQP